MGGKPLDSSYSALPLWRRAFAIITHVPASEHVDDGIVEHARGRINRDQNVLVVEFLKARWQGALSRQLKKALGRPQLLPCTTITSIIRFQKNGFWYQFALNQIMKMGYLLGLSDQSLNSLY